MHVTHILPLLFVCAIGGRQIIVQLNYSFFEGNLVLQCKVYHGYLSVFIVDFNGKEQGFCRPTPVPQCFNYFPNSTKLLYNSSTNVTTFIKGASDISKIIGNWKCRHGSGDDNPSRTIYVSMNAEEPIYNHVTAATFLIYVAVVMGCVPIIQVRFCKVLRKIIEYTGTSNLCNSNNWMYLILLKLGGIIPKCRHQSDRKNYRLLGIKLILCLFFVLFPYLTVRIIDVYYFRNTKDPPIGVYIFLIVEGSIIGVVFSKTVLTLVGKIEDNTTEHPGIETLPEERNGTAGIVNL